MKEFILTYYKELIALGCFLIELLFTVVILIKKSKKDTGVVGAILSNLPAVINLVEKKFGSGTGTTKKVQALDTALELYRSMTGVCLTYDSQIAHILSDAIEDILSTPQKKG